ncbi:MAG: Uma2 family endonuclease [Cyanobium sp. M30B3]|nr:MAG: Uma2 family endonuclease [Cyanobium sp. M30B3]
MTSTPTPPAPASLFDALAPLRLPPDLRLTPEQFERVCAENREAVLELAADGALITMTPASSETSGRNSRVVMRLLLWADRQGGWKVFESSAGFRLPDGSVRSPDASLLRLERWQALSPAERRSFAPLCPDLVVELASPSDEGPRGVSALRQKMAAYQANGARLGWLLLPHERAVEVWGPAHQEARNQEANQEEPLRLELAATLEGGAEFPGLCLNLEEIWAE